MTRVWEWAKKWGLALLGGLLFFMSLKWIIGSRNEEIGRLKDKLSVEDATGEIERLRDVRKRVLADVSVDDGVIEELDKELAKNRRLLVEASNEDNTELTDDEIEEEFAKLGV